MQRFHTRTPAISAPLSGALVLGLTGGLVLTALGPAHADGTPTTPPVTAPVAPAAPTDVKAVGGNARLTVSWLQATTPVAPTGYAVYALPKGGTTKQLTCAPVTDVAGRKQCVATSFADGTPIVNGTSYTVTLRALNDTASSAVAVAAAPAVPAAVPGAPTIKKVVPADSGAFVSWNAAAPNGAKVTLYRVYTSGSRATCSTNGTALNCTVAGLTNGKKYRFRVAALNAKGTGPVSAWSAIVVPALPPATKLPIKFGQKGVLVTALQQRLGWAGLPVRVNGYFDANTQKMVKRFQGKFFLDQTGVVNQNTWNKLVSLTRGNGALPTACRTGTVICVQKSLKLVRYLVNGVPKLILDARFGSESTPTRNGMHSVYIKSRNHVSSLYGSPMPFALFFDGGQALHYSMFFASVGYNGASHGCVNLRDYDGARRLFDMTSYGTRVFITN